MENCVGFRFHPTDEEIINHYLSNKTAGRTHLTHAIAEIDFYGSEPWELPARSQIQSDDQVWYFFCHQDKRSGVGWNRQTEQGFWKKTGQDRKIRPRGSRSEIGTKKTLVFYNGRANNAARTGWVMHEYSPTPAAAPPDAMAYVVCRVKHKVDDNNEFVASSRAPSGSSNNNVAATDALPQFLPQQDTELINRQVEADFDLALQEFMRDQVLSLGDLSHVRNASPINRDWMQEEGLSLDDLQFEDDVIQPVAIQTQIDTIEQEDDFVNSMFADQDEYISDQDEYISHQDVYNLLNDHGPSSPFRGACALNRHDNDGQLFDQVQRNSGLYNNPFGSKEEHQKRMENTVKHDDIMLMNPSVVETTIATGFQTNQIDEESSVPSRPSRPQCEPKSIRLGAMSEKGLGRTVLPGGFLSEASPNKVRKSAQSGLSVVHAKTEASISKSNKGHKTDKPTVTKSSSSSNSHRSASSGRKSSPPTSTKTKSAGGEMPPSAYICNIVVGLIIFISIIWHGLPGSAY